jgi:hypothetical protein
VYSLENSLSKLKKGSKTEKYKISYCFNFMVN